MSKALVMGSAGFIGSALVSALGDAETFDLRTGQDGLDLAVVMKSVEGKDTVFHLANNTSHRLSVDDPYNIIRNNFFVTLNVVEACRQHRAKLVFASSLSVYGTQDPPFREDSPMKPSTPYGVVKQCCEQLLEEYHKRYGLDIVVVRPSNVWGTGDSLQMPPPLLRKWKKAVKSGEPLIVNGENTSRDFTHIHDCVSGIIKSSQTVGWNVFNLAGGREIRLLDVAHRLSSDVVIAPRKAYQAERSFADIEKARRVLDWHPRVDFWEELVQYVESPS